MMRYALGREPYRGSTPPVSYRVIRTRSCRCRTFCREFAVSRSAGYRWICRYKEVGPEGLLDLSRRPHGCSHATLDSTENAIVALRNKHPSWGARKLKARLEVLQPPVVWPVASTFDNILSRAGLTNPKQKKRRTTPYSEPFSMVTAPNQLWCVDFKNYFGAGAGSQCDPFMITDAHAHSRYLIRGQGVLRMNLNEVAMICEAAMRDIEFRPEHRPRRHSVRRQRLERRYQLAQRSCLHQSGIFIRGSRL